MKAAEMFFALENKADSLVKSGTSNLDPVVRSIYRKMYKIYRDANTIDREAMDFVENIHFA